MTSAKRPRTEPAPRRSQGGSEEICVVGVDIGGTFTDFYLVDRASGRSALGKVLTTPDDPSRAVMEGLETLLQEVGLDFGGVRTIIHGTTLVTNVLIERKGARTGLLTTAGFRDILEMRREKRYDIYDLFLELPEPLVSRELRLGVQERMGPGGEVLAPLCSDSVTEAIERLRREGVHSVAVCFLHAFQNPAHERAVGEMLAERAPEMFCSLSSDVCPEIREFERCSTTVANAYVQPLMKTYLSRLEERLSAAGFRGPLFLMLSNGGVTTVDSAKRYPIRSVESGPAGGAVAAARLAAARGLPRAISFDMGGTTAKIALIEGGEPQLTTAFEAARVYRFKKGSGLPVKVPVIEMIEIGTGGGSLARVDEMGLLKVGPQSAGADPGPVCYGRGGKEPTVTDADLLLGYLDASYFLGGQMPLDVEGARRAVQEQVTGPLGVSLERAAAGIHQIANESMANAARMHAVERGRTPHEYALIAFGGAGPVHAYGVARNLGMKTILVPPSAGVASALGFTLAPFSFDFVRTHVALLSGLPLEVPNALFAEMESEGRKVLAQGGVAPRQITYIRSADMRYKGQGHEVAVLLPPGVWTEDQREEIRRAFHQTYEKIYHRANPDVDVETVNWRLRVAGPPPPGARPPARSRTSPRSRKGTRPVYFSERNGFIDCPVYDRYSLGSDFSCEGPLIIEERESTVVVGPKARASVDADLNVRIDIAG
ncbi:MAG: hydantoinase/oxoprolinase family protein [Candidatus Tectomicrobia bacterium]|nr:hydantoinase/oxoprolinase family protein [Candidatus Tectomicrobia bacterium]